ncbi:VWA domain-containing protein [Planctomycetota bacterium]|nr:VWA domain-containing protein [Planctomycetota bacterium]
MPGLQKFILIITALLVLLTFGVFITVGVDDASLFSLIAPGSTFSWDNFDPFSRSTGSTGISPLIWTALVAVPVALLLPLMIYLYEKKNVSRPMRVMLAVSRTASLLLLYLLIAGPSLVDSEKFVESSKVAVLIDDSLSMGAESREFPIFNVLDDRESAGIKKLRKQLDGLGISVEAPPARGFVSLSEDELLVRDFVRQTVLERAGRLIKRLNTEHGKSFDLKEWQRQRKQVDLLSQQADLKQSELSAETSREEPDLAHVRRLEAELKQLLNQVRVAQDSFAEMLGGDMQDDKTKQRLALVNNLLETVHPEGPRRWDIASELLMEGNSLAVRKGGDVALLDIVKQRAEKVKNDGNEADESRRMPILRFFVFSTRFGRKQMTDEAIVEIDRSELDYREPKGRLTEIDMALAQVRRYYSEEDDLSAILVLTDGRDTSPESGESEITENIRKGLAVSFVAIGNPKPVKVLELLSVNADREVLKGDYVDFKLKIRADKAYRADAKKKKEGIKVKVILCEDSLTNEVPYEEINGKAVRSDFDKMIEIGPEELAEVKIRFKPQNPGKHVYFLKINEDRLPDEDTYRNNVKEHYLEVIDRKIKVLYIEQRARWLWRWLNTSLKNDKKLEYHGFLINADEGWEQPVSTHGDGLKDMKPLRAPFHDGNRVIRDKEDFFKLNYDVIILGDIDASGANFQRVYWDWLEEWVSRHRGGLILLAGESHNPSGYVNIEKARSLFPIELDAIKNSSGGAENARKKYYNLTPAGRAHEIHRLSTNPETNAELWGRMEGDAYKPGELNSIFWCQQHTKIKPAPAVVLSRAAREGQKGNNGEILTATMPYGNGMVMYSGSDDQWYWREFYGDHWFYRFFQNSIRFVASRRLAGKQQRVDVYTDRTKYQVSDDIKVYVELMGNIYDEVTQNQKKDLSELPGGGVGDAETTRNIIVDLKARSQGRLTSRSVVLSEVAWSPNLFEGVVQANEPGQFDVWVRDYEESMKTPHRYLVVAPVAELRNLTMDFNGMLERASKLPQNHVLMEYQNGRRVWHMTDAGQVSLEVREKTNEIKGMSKLIWDRQDEKFGLRSALLVLLLLLLASEWLNRKLLRMV